MSWVVPGPPTCPVDAYPVCETTWTTVVTAQSNAVCSLVEAIQREDITREDIARTVVEGNASLHALAVDFLDTSKRRQSVHKFCAAVRAVDPATLDRTVDLLIHQRVSQAEVMQVQQQMQEQRQHARAWQQRADMDMDERRH